MIKKVILIGNGFDIAHSLKTSYFEFQKEVSDPIIDKFHAFVNDIDTDVPFFDEYGNVEKITWYSFEDQIERLSIQKFQCNFADDGKTEHYKKIEDGMNELNKLFEGLSELLFNYLEKETNKKVQLLASVKKEFCKETLAISFNYTDTIKNYTSKYYFVHGSIHDDHRIIIGFARNQISDLATNNFSQFSKFKQKEILNYYRFLKSCKYANIKKLMCEFDSHANCLFSGKGGYDFPLIEVGECEGYDLNKVSKALTDYASRNNYLPAVEEFDYSNVEEIIIMGHGLEADLLYIKNVFEKSKKLKKVKLFKYNGEPKIEIERKKRVIKRMATGVPLEICSY